MELQKHQSGLPSLRNEPKQLASVLCHVNQLSPFPVPDDTLLDWSDSINEIIPNLEISDLQEVLRLLKTGDLPYDTKAGIQNIFKGLRTKFGRKYFEPKPVY